MARVNVEQVLKVAEFLKRQPQVGPGLNFYSFFKDGEEIVQSNMYPALRHPQALNFFFFVCMHQFCFWIGNDRGYEAPLYGAINGKTGVKGSDLLWQMCMRALNKDETIFTPKRLAEISYTSFTRDIFADDNGPYPFPDLEDRFRLTRAYGEWLKKENVSTFGLVSLSNELYPESLAAFRLHLDPIPGYRGDPLQKKILLLAMALANRPEKFLKVHPREKWPPIIDYHVMRVALRLGLVDLDEDENSVSEERNFVDPETERGIRNLVFRATEELIRSSGLPMSAIDEKLWMARRYCPEMEEPNCAKCLFEPVCKKRVKLFQPVLRTTNY